jgi:hypothetical protein
VPVARIFMKRAFEAFRSMMGKKSELGSAPNARK